MDKKPKRVIEKKKLIMRLPFSKVKVGELGALLPNREVEVDGDRKEVRVYKRFFIEFY